MIEYLWIPGTNYIVESTPELLKVAHQRGLVPYDPYSDVRTNPLDRGLKIPNEPLKPDTKVEDEFDISTATKLELDVYARKTYAQNLDRRKSLAQMREDLFQLKTNNNRTK